MNALAWDYFNNLEKPVAAIFKAMENRGIRINTAYLNSLKEQLEAQEGPLKAAILNELGNINLDAPKQLLEALNQKGINPTFKGKPSTDQRGTLYTVYGSNPVVKRLKEWGEVNTLLTCFVYPYLDRKVEYIHPFFNQCGTRTGRPSCSNPNLLQIPRKTKNGKLVRSMFIPRAGMSFGCCDYGQIEPRVLAHLSKDPAMLTLFNNGTDFHSYFAGKINVSRDVAKVFDLEVYYRATRHGVDRHLHCGLDQAEKYINMAWNLFPGLRRWEEEVIFNAKRSGFGVTPMGRRIKIENLDSPKHSSREAAERQLINNIVQGSAAEIIKNAMILIYNDLEGRLSDKFGMLVQVYDELLAESDEMKEDLPVMVDYMEHCIKLDVPLVVDAHIGANWNEAKG